MGACNAGCVSVPSGEPPKKKYKSKTHQAVEEMMQKRRAYMEAQRRSEIDESARILEAHQVRPSGYPGPTELRPGLFLGSLYDALDAPLLLAKGITHVVNATQAEMPQDNLRRLDVRVDDDLDADIYPHFSAVCDFVESALESGGRVLVHCEQGISRSAALLSAHVMRQRGRTALEALRSLKSKRQIVDPNPGFLQALLDWERQLQPGQVQATSLSELQALCAPPSDASQPVAMWRVKSSNSSLRQGGTSDSLGRNQKPSSSSLFRTSSSLIRKISNNSVQRIISSCGVRSL